MSDPQKHRFDEIAVEVKKKVDPSIADVDHYVGLEHLDPGSLVIRRWGDPSEVESSKIRFKAGDIIFGKRRAYQRKLAVAHFDGICSAHAMVLRPKVETVVPEFLPFFMQSDLFMDRAVKISVGGLSPTINWKDLAKEEFVLPPMEEQRRVAEALMSLELSAERLLGVVNAGMAAVASFREHCFGIAGGSATSTLGALCQQGSGIQIGPFGAQLHQSDYVDEGIPVVMPSDLQDGSISMDRISRVSLEKARELSQHRLKVGDIVLPRRGDLDRRALATEEQEGWLCGTGSLRARLDDPSLADLVLQSLASGSVLRWLESRAVGTTMPNLNSKIIAAIPVRLPEQAHVAIEAIRRAASAVRAAEGRLSDVRGLQAVILAGCVN